MSCNTNYLLSKGVVPKTFSNDNLYFNPDDPQRPYERRKGTEKTAVHWGQRKLLLAVVQFFVSFWDVIKQIENPQVIYAGAAPGTNINLLVKMFPSFTWHLYDPRNVWKIKASDTVRIYTGKDNGYFTDEVAKSWRYKKNAKGEQVERNDVIFLSDIRLTTSEFDQYRKSGVEVSNVALTSIAMGMDDQVKLDMTMQEDWYNLMRPVIASFKFRLPYVLIEGNITAPVPAGQKVVAVSETAFSIYQRGQIFGVKKMMKTNYGSQYVLLHGPVILRKDKSTKTFILDQGFKFSLSPGDDVLVPNQELRTEYLSGYVAKGIWAPQTSTEGRHTPSPIRNKTGNVETSMLWDNLAYESQQFWQNTIGRQLSLFYNIFTGELEPYVGSELCNDFDSTAEAYVLYMYMQKVHKVKVQMDYVNLLSNLMTVYINVGALTDIDQDLNSDLTVMQENYPFDSTNKDNPWHLVASALDKQQTRKKKRVWLTLSKIRNDPSFIKKTMQQRNRIKSKTRKLTKIPAIAGSTIYQQQIKDIDQEETSPVPSPASSIISSLPRVSINKSQKTVDETTIKLSELVTIFDVFNMNNNVVVAAPPQMYNAGPQENLDARTYTVAIAPPKNYVEYILI